MIGRITEVACESPDANETQLAPPVMAWEVEPIALYVPGHIMAVYDENGEHTGKFVDEDKLAALKDISRIGNAFAEYDEIFKRYNNSSIYKELHVSKTNNTFEENYEIVLDHMDDALVSSKYIGEFLLSTKQTAAYEINRLHHLDRETKGFDSFGSKEDMLKSALDQSSALMDTLNKFFVAYRPPVQGLFECYSAPLEAMQEVLKTALDMIGQFKSNTSEAPYAILHYDPAVKKVASAYLSLSLGDPVTEGTRYNEMAGKMLQRCKELAKTVAKLSP